MHPLTAVALGCVLVLTASSVVFRAGYTSGSMHRSSDDEPDRLLLMEALSQPLPPSPAATAPWSLDLVGVMRLLGFERKLATPDVWPHAGIDDKEAVAGSCSIPLNQVTPGVAAYWATRGNAAATYSAVGVSINGMAGKASPVTLHAWSRAACVAGFNSRGYSIEVVLGRVFAPFSTTAGNSDATSVTTTQRGLDFPWLVFDYDEATGKGLYLQIRPTGYIVARCMTLHDGTVVKEGGDALHKVDKEDYWGEEVYEVISSSGRDVWQRERPLLFRVARSGTLLHIYIQDIVWFFFPVMRLLARVEVGTDLDELADAQLGVGVVPGRSQFQVFRFTFTGTDWLTWGVALAVVASGAALYAGYAATRWLVQRSRSSSTDALVATMDQSKEPIVVKYGRKLYLVMPDGAAVQVMRADDDQLMYTAPSGKHVRVTAPVHKLPTSRLSYLFSLLVRSKASDDSREGDASATAPALSSTSKPSPPPSRGRSASPQKRPSSLVAGYASSSSSRKAGAKARPASRTGIVAVPYASSSSSRGSRRAAGKTNASGGSRARHRRHKSSGGGSGGGSGGSRARRRRAAGAGSKGSRSNAGGGGSSGARVKPQA